jgi:hypothetical protein
MQSREAMNWRTGRLPRQQNYQRAEMSRTALRIAMRREMAALFVHNLSRHYHYK